VFDRYNIVSETDLEEAATKIESGREKRKHTLVGIRKIATDTRTSTTTKSKNQKQVDVVA
jgi:hypothetical protein